MKPSQEKQTVVEDKSKFQQELDATKIIHGALLAVDPGRREAILKAVAILLRIYIPSE